jgi:hypothetical protein
MVKEIIELFDWIVNEKNVRGSRMDDNGLWLHTSAKPEFFDPITRLLFLEDKSNYLLQKSTICKALDLNKKSDKILFNLPLPPSSQ